MYMCMTAIPLTTEINLKKQLKKQKTKIQIHWNKQKQKLLFQQESIYRISC